MTLELAAGGWRATLLPGLGGAIGSLSFRGCDVLRPTPSGTADVLATSCFPLFPYANRVANGRFIWAGDAVQLPVLPGFAPHAIHGVGWQRAWQVNGVNDSAAQLRLDAGGDGGWPWRFVAEQDITLTDAGLRIDLRLTNCDDNRVPAGLGLHPYFPLGAGGRLSLTAKKVWLSDETLIPSTLADASAIYDFAQGERLPARTLIDHCYEGWDGVAELTIAERSVTVKADTGRVHIYAPQAGGFCCVEPVTHRPDALNARPDEPGMPVIEPGAQTSLRMEISAVNTTASQPAQ
ncbi:aldose 1-epimerase [Glycocaulis abyssi]|uniref:Aldose 1-epimerase n=1 Tax=Glycocaulis abyssi TaxID=1433403 RepID=A0ABV9N8B3_9PROT